MKIERKLQDPRVQEILKDPKVLNFIQYLQSQK